MVEGHQHDAACRHYGLDGSEDPDDRGKRPERTIMTPLFRRRPKRVALRRLEFAADFRARWRQLIGAPGKARVTLALASSAFVVSGALAGPSRADPFLTQDELNFIGAVAPEGYGGDVYATIRAGHEVCSLLD